MAGLEDTARPNYAKYLCKGLACAKKVSNVMLLAAVAVVAMTAAGMITAGVVTAATGNTVVVHMQGVVVHV